MADMNVTAKFTADISDMKSKMDTIAKSMASIDMKTKQTGKGFTLLRGTIANAFGTALSGGITAAAGALTGFLSGTVSAAAEMEQANRRLEQISASMGVLDTALGGSTQRLQDYANELQTLTGVNDESIKAGQALLLTFENVAKTAGETGGMFDRATAASLDLAAAGFGSVDTNAKQLGKALQDPVKGITALSRSGVTFTAAEKDMIKAMVETGQVAQAQEMIMSAVEKQVGGTAEATATGAMKMKASMDDLQEAIGVGIYPIVNSLAEALIPILNSLQEPLAQVASVVGGALTQAFNALAPVIPVVATTLGTIVQTLATALAPVLSNLMPAIIPLLEAFQYLAVQIGPLLGDVVGRLAEVLAAVLNAVTPLLKPLIDLVMGILNAAWPIISTVIDVVLELVSALTPLLDAVMMLLTPLGELIEVLLAAILPIIQPIVPVIALLAQVMGQVLVKAVGVLMVILGELIKGLSKIAPFVLKNVTAPVVKAFISMASGVVGAAADMLGWVPGLGDKLREAESSLKQFATDTERNIKQAGDTIEREGSRIGQNMANAGQQALAGAAPALGQAAAQTGAYVAGQYNNALAQGMGAAAYAATYGAKPPTPVKPPASPTPAPSPSGTSGGAKAADDQEKKRLEKIQKFVDGFKAALERIKQGQQGLLDATKRAGAEFGDVLGDMLPKSAVEEAFGPTGSISTVISQYDQLDAAVTDLYKPLMNAKRFGKMAADTAKANMENAKSFLKAATATALALMKAREENLQALDQLDKDYASQVDSINSTYDALDRAAAANTKAIEARWDATINSLEKALSAANDAFNRENDVLQGLIAKRDSFLDNVRSGFRSFVNNLSFETKQATKEIIRETQVLANGITVTLEREIEVGGGVSSIREQLQARLDAVREFSTNIRTLIQRGLDPTLVQDFVSAGVAGAGEAAASLASASNEELAGINAAQAALAAEVASFQTYASQQWFHAGIAQQEAIVGPLAAARDQAQAALDAANAARTAELAAAKAHEEALKAQRQAALDAAKAQYEAQKEALKAQGVEIETALTNNATMLHNGIAELQNTVPPEMFNAGKKSVEQMLSGFQDKFPGVKSKLNSMMDGLAASMNRTSTITITTVHRSVYEAPKLGFMAKGGPVQAANAYIVGEKGPELFIPGVGGNIIPNHKLASVPSMAPSGGGGGGGGTTINLNINAGMGADGAEIGRQVVEAIRKYERRSGPVFASA